jgi:uncharacterized protein YdeI (YjbR/CyaY-like superfamily)
MPDAPQPPNAVHCQTRAEWRAWLEQNHTRTEGIWLVSHKKATGLPRITYAESVEEALCFGWVDSKGNKLDEARSMLWFAPRRPGSGWSRVNKERVERLIAEGSMAPAGMAKIEAAKLDGSWYLLDAVEDLTIPPDLAQALDNNPAARANFDAFPRSVKRGILEWIVRAKRAETRTRRIADTVQQAAQNHRANQWKQ